MPLRRSWLHEYERRRVWSTGIFSRISKTARHTAKSKTVTPIETKRPKTVAIITPDDGGHLLDHFLKAAYLVAKKLDWVNFVVAIPDGVAMPSEERLAMLGLKGRLAFRVEHETKAYMDLECMADLVVAPHTCASKPSLTKTGRQRPLIICREERGHFLPKTAAGADVWDYRRLADLIVMGLAEPDHLAKEIKAHRGDLPGESDWGYPIHH